MFSREQHDDNPRHQAEKLLPIRSATHWTEDGIISTESERAAGRPFERFRSVQLDRARRYLPTIVNWRWVLRDALSRFRCRQYAKDGIRVNAVAPGIIDTPMQQDAPKDFLKTLQSLGGTSEVADIVDAVVYLTEAKQVTGELLHVDGGGHVGRWQVTKILHPPGAEQRLRELGIKLPAPPRAVRHLC